MTHPTVVVEHGTITWITLNRPDQRNAINDAMRGELIAALRAAEADDAVRVMILRGDGPVFSAGDDLYEIAQQEQDAPKVSADAITARHLDLQIWQDIRKPVIGAVHGYVGPSAVGILHVLDLAVAAEGTVLSYEQVRIGGAPPALIPTLTMGHHKVKEWQLMGGAFPAEEAEKHGLINKVVPMHQLYDTAERWAEMIVAIPPQSVLANKHLINQVYEMVGVRTSSTLAAAMSGVARSSTVDAEFFRTVRESGLKAALAFRDQNFASLGD
jgi:enoyl-CoA hydratase